MKSLSRKKSKVKKAIKELTAPKIDAAELFSHFTASIINKNVLFTR